MGQGVGWWLVAVGLVVGTAAGAQGAQEAKGLLEEDFDGLAGTLAPAQDEAIDAMVLGWTHTPPAGWSVDATAMSPDKGVTEWRGWSFTTAAFWSQTENQGRDRFSLAEGVFAVADSDEYDDKDGPDAFDSTLVSPVLSVPAGKTAYVAWDSFYRRINDSISTFSVSINGGPDVVVKDFQGHTVENVRVTFAVEPPTTAEAWSLVLKWRYRAKNGWFWAIDNLRVTDAPPAPPAPLAPLAAPEDWPTYRHDCSRTGITSTELVFPLGEAWRHVPAHAPSPAWPPPAEQDITNRAYDLKQVNDYDHAYHVAAVENRLYYGSSADDTIYCLNAADGAVVWTHVTEGPVRLAPTVTGGRVYAGSDDGCVYCLDAATGALRWRQRVGPSDQRLPGNGRMISLWPVRSSVMVNGPTAYATAGLFPSQGAYIMAMNADDGTVVWKQALDVSTQGYMLASPTRLFIGTGRTPPAFFDIATGKPLGSIQDLGHGDTGGCFALVLDDMLVHATSERGNVHIAEPQTGEKIVSTPGSRIIAHGGMVYILGAEDLSALDRDRYLDLSRDIQAIEWIDARQRTQEQNDRLRNLHVERKACLKWKTPHTDVCELIMAGEALILGQVGGVRAVATTDGRELWSAEVEGKACGLAVARGQLIVSTDAGTIYGFAQGATGEQPRVAHAAGVESTNLPDAAAADAILGSTPTRQGYSLVLGIADGRLVRALAEHSAFSIIVAEADADRASKARAWLSNAGLYGVRVVVHEVGPESLPYPDYFANLIVSERSMVEGAPPQIPAAEVARVLRPRGGTLALTGTPADALEAWAGDALPDWSVTEGLATARRGPIEGEGEWTHTYAEPGNSACSGDTMPVWPIRLQWFGPPGPRRIVDRHFRNVPPLYKDGRVFIPGNGIVYAADAYNGTLLWSAEVANSLRIGVFLDTSNMVVDDEFLYIVAEDQCHRFGVVTGEENAAFGLPEPVDGQPGEWGYLAYTGNLLLGTGRKPGTGYRKLTREDELQKNAVWYPNMTLALSDYIFVADRATGETRWIHRGGRIIETTLAADDGRVYFVESEDPVVTAPDARRVMMREIAGGGHQYLTALNLSDGSVAFRKPIDTANLQQPSYLACAQGVILLSGSRIVGGEGITNTGAATAMQIKGDEHIHYYYYAFDSTSGETVWTTDHATTLRVDGGHGEYNRHPTIVGETVYAWPYAYNVKTGQRIEGWTFDRQGHGCGGISASAHGLFWRGGNPWLYDLRPGGGSHRITSVTRPGCWINMLAVGGLIVIPEADAGCTCGFPIQTSLALAPLKRGQTTN
ncbi:MAG TPA: PQQ-binding-like beta-propeller repeat protein [Candidatus Hydrogenedentes bacterium]|nr:PQQ-binding-like beta-propeller repeat protein [Candidatus Hydrogenedentota bacterium]HPG68009.1 PQQ-binding-like beta-propeller repeat protein [Candidatus Hydrogenedentota bacterium]